MFNYYFIFRDNVKWEAEQEEDAKKAIILNSSIKMSPTEAAEYRLYANKYWNKFYDNHGNRFFKDRQWLFTEFPELQINNKIQPVSEEHSSELKIFELGCGAGSTIIPILKYSSNRKLHIFGCDFSENAIKLLKSSQHFDETRCTAFVMDATHNKWESVPFEADSLDIIVLIFVLSSIEPSHISCILNNCKYYLKPGGLVLLRDYGQYDLAQLRFKSGKCLDNNLYVRGDGTMAYFFTQNEIRDLFLNAGFIEEQNVVDRRLQVNRSRMLKMYRVWIQAKYRKPTL